jgi:hypothetical protein
MRYIPMRYTTMRYTRHETYTHEAHAHEVHIFKIHAYEIIPGNLAGCVSQQSCPYLSEIATSTKGNAV